MLPDNLSYGLATDRLNWASTCTRFNRQNKCHWTDTLHFYCWPCTFFCPPALSDKESISETSVGIPYFSQMFPGLLWTNTINLARADTQANR